MSATLTAAAYPVLAFLLTYLVHSTVVFGAAWLVSRRWRARPGVREVIWKVAVVMTLVTTAAETYTNNTERLRAERMRPAEAGVHPPGARSESALQPRDGATRLLPGSLHVPHPAAVQVDLSVPAPWAVTIALLWALGALGGVAQHVRARRRLTTNIARGELPADAQLLALIERLRRRMNIRRALRVIPVRGAGSPFAVGRSTVVIPNTFWSELPEAQREAILAHELAHLARCDVPWLNAGTVLARIFFFQPLHRVARAKITEVAEFLCDEIATDCTGCHTALAESLLALAEHLSLARRMSVAHMAAASGAPLLQRIERITSGLPISPRLPRARVAGPSIVVMACLTWALTPAMMPAPTEISPSQRANAAGHAQVRPASADLDPRVWNTYMVHTHVLGGDTVRTQLGTMGLHEWRRFNPGTDETSGAHLLIVSHGPQGERRLEIVPSPGGDVVRFELNGVPAAYDASARRWLADRLADLKS